MEVFTAPTKYYNNHCTIMTTTSTTTTTIYITTTTTTPTTTTSVLLLCLLLLPLQPLSPYHYSCCNSVLLLLPLQLLLILPLPLRYQHNSNYSNNHHKAASPTWLNETGTIDELMFPTEMLREKITLKNTRVFHWVLFFTGCFLVPEK